MTTSYLLPWCYVHKELHLWNYIILLSSPWQQQTYIPTPPPTPSSFFGTNSLNKWQLNSFGRTAAHGISGRASCWNFDSKLSLTSMVYLQRTSAKSLYNYTITSSNRGSKKQFSSQVLQQQTHPPSLPTLSSFIGTKSLKAAVKHLWKGPSSWNFRKILMASLFIIYQHCKNAMVKSSDQDIYPQVKKTSQLWLPPYK